MCAIYLHKYLVPGCYIHVYVLVIYRNIFNLSQIVAKNRKEVINFLYFYPSAIIFV